MLARCCLIAVLFPLLVACTGTRAVGKRAASPPIVACDSESECLIDELCLGPECFATQLYGAGVDAVASGSSSPPAPVDGG